MRWAWFMAAVGSLITMFVAYFGTVAIIDRKAYAFLMLYTLSVSGTVAVFLGLGWLAFAAAAFGYTVLRAWPQTRNFGTQIATISIFAFAGFQLAATLLQIVKVYGGFAL